MKKIAQAAGPLYGREGRSLPKEESFGLPPLPEDAKAKTVNNFGLPAMPKERAEVPRPSENNSFSAVKTLQTAILQFADAASSSDITSMQKRETGKQDSSSGEFLGGSDPFGNFLAHHIRGAGKQGMQYTNVDVASSDRARMGIEDTGLRGIIDSIKRVGTPGNEKSVDGIWKQRTNNALHEIGKLMTTVNDLSASMNLPLKGLSATLRDFLQAVPKQYTDIKDPGQQALELAAMIKSLMMDFITFRERILKDPELKQFISQEKPFAHYPHKPSSARETLSEEEKKMFVGNRPIPGLLLAKQQVSLSDLDNMGTFSKLMRSSGRNPQDPKQVQNTLVELSQALGGAS